MSRIRSYNSRKYIMSSLWKNNVFASLHEFRRWRVKSCWPNLKSRILKYGKCPLVWYLYTCFDCNIMLSSKISPKVKYIKFELHWEERKKYWDYETFYSALCIVLCKYPQMCKTVLHLLMMFLFMEFTAIFVWWGNNRK